MSSITYILLYTLSAMDWRQTAGMMDVYIFEYKILLLNPGAPLWFLTLKLS